MTSTLADARRLPARIALALAVAASIALGAQLSLPLPFSPVPVSLQTLFVALAALLLPWRTVDDGVLLYLALGALGLPVFASGKAGLGVLLGPTGGFLVGFVLAAPVTAFVVSHFQARLRWALDLVGALGLHLLVLAIGVGWLATATERTLSDAISVGGLPFLLGAVVKSLAAAGLAACLRRWVPSSAN